MWLFGNSRKRMEAQLEAQLLAPNLIHIAEDCENIVNTTVNPDTFFSRYDLLVEQLIKLSEIERYIKFTGKLPSVALKRVISQRDTVTQRFIYRSYQRLVQDIAKLKTANGKLNRINAYFNHMHFYDSYLSDDNKRLLDQMHVELSAGKFAQSQNKTEEVNIQAISKSEAILLKYLDGHKVGSSLPNYFSYEPHKLNTEACITKFLKAGLLVYAPVEYVLTKCSVNDLKEILREHGLKLSGKKSELADRILNNIDHSILQNRFSKQYFSLSKQAKELVAQTLDEYDYELRYINYTEITAEDLENFSLSDLEDRELYFNYIKSDIDFPLQLAEHKNKVQNLIFLYKLQGLRSETIKKLIAKTYALDVPISLIEESTKSINSIRSFIRASKELKTLQDLDKVSRKPLTYSISSMKDEHCCSFCRELEGKRFRVKDAVIGENYPPFNSCKNEFCRCYASFRMFDDED